MLGSSNTLASDANLRLALEEDRRDGVDGPESCEPVFEGVGLALFEVDWLLTGWGLLGREATAFTGFGLANFGTTSAIRRV